MELEPLPLVLALIHCRWKQVADMHEARCYSSATVMDGKIYVAGGYHGQASTSLLILRLHSPPPPPYFHLLLLRQLILLLIYAGEQVNLDSAEVWSAGEWHKISSMSTPRRGLGLAALDGHLYAVGGWDGRKNLSSVTSCSPAEGIDEVSGRGLDAFDGELEEDPRPLDSSFLRETLSTSLRLACRSTPFRSCCYCLVL